MQVKVSLLFVLGALSVALVNATPSAAEAKEVKAEKADGKWIPPYIWDGLYHEKRGEAKQKEGKYIPAYIWDGLYTETRHGETGKVVDGKWIPAYIWDGLYHEKRAEQGINPGLTDGLYHDKRQEGESGINPDVTDGLDHEKRAKEDGQGIPPYIGKILANGN